MKDGTECERMGRDEKDRKRMGFFLKEWE